MRRIAVAYSAGRDSSALLHATVAQAHALGVGVLAFHVHHGLSPQADAWVAHGEEFCRRSSRAGKPVALVVRRLLTQPAPGESVEAWARAARYQALVEMAREQATEVVLLAHHQRDQAETWILQALRGAGVAGLAAMAPQFERDGVTFIRPWLAWPREAIDAYVRRHRLKHVEDDSNAHARYARNRLRLSVWPALIESFPQADASLAQAAAWAQQAREIVDEVAAHDLRQIVRADGALVLDGWLALSPARRSQALRAWLGQGSTAALVTRLLAELPSLRTGRWSCQGAGLRLYRGLLRMCPDVPERAEVPLESVLQVRAPGPQALPGWDGVLEVSSVVEGGVPLAWLGHAELRARRGGERFQAGLMRPPRSLKKQYQAAGVAEWEREGPLVYSGGQLVYVPGLGLDARVIGLPGQALVALHWRPTRPS